MFCCTAVLIYRVLYTFITTHEFTLCSCSNKGESCDHHLHTQFQKCYYMNSGKAGNPRGRLRFETMGQLNF